jgi:hypothetical protein
MFCRECGTQVDGAAVACGRCGADVGEVRTGSATPVATPSPSVSGVNPPEQPNVPEIDGWGDPTSFVSPPSQERPGRSTQDPPDLGAAAASEPLPVAVIKWETLETIREWPAKVLHNTNNVPIDFITNTIIAEIRGREYPIAARSVRIDADVERFKQFERTCLGLCSTKYPHLAEVYLAIHVEPEGKDLVLGLSLLRISSVKFLCNEALLPATQTYWGIDDNFHWNNRTKVWGILQEFVQDAVNKFSGRREAFLNALAPFETAYPAVAGFRGSCPQMFQEEQQMETAVATRNVAIRDLEKNNANATQELGQRLAEAQTRRTACQKSRESSPTKVGWGTFGGFILLAILSQTGAFVGFAILGGVAAGLITMGVTSSNLSDAKAECERLGQESAEQLRQAGQQVAADKQKLSDIERRLAALRQKIQTDFKTTLDDIANAVFRLEERWLVQRVTDPSLERFMQLGVNVVNEVQARVFPNTQPFKLMDYE